MKAFYSVLYIRPEPVSDEKISIGLFLNSTKKPLFNFSEKKLKIAAKLIGSDTADSIERMLKKGEQSIVKLTAIFEACFGE